MGINVSDWYTDGPVPFRYRGEDIQSVEFVLRPGERIIAQPGAFLCGGGGVRALGITWGRRLLDPFYRKWSGEASVLNEIICENEPGFVVLSAAHIGRIVRMRLEPGHSLICQRGAFMASTGQIDLGIAFTRRVRAGLFGGQGAVFQRITGEGDVFLHAFGSYIDKWLEPGRIMRVSTDNILAFDGSVGYDVQLSGGLLTLLFGGKEGLFLSQLEGPGRVIVQSLDHGEMRKALQKQREQASLIAGPVDADQNTP